MWNLDDETLYEPFVRLQLAYAQTYGANDRSKREVIRQLAITQFSVIPTGTQRWAFRIFVRRTGIQSFDLDNVPKLIVDSFCGSQIVRDESPHARAELYPKDTLDHVAVIQVAGERCSESDSTVIEIFRRRS